VKVNDAFGGGLVPIAAHPLATLVVASMTWVLPTVPVTSKLSCPGAGWRGLLITAGPGGGLVIISVPCIAKWSEQIYTSELGALKGTAKVSVPLPVPLFVTPLL